MPPAFRHLHAIMRQHPDKNRGQAGEPGGYLKALHTTGRDVPEPASVRRAYGAELPMVAAAVVGVMLLRSWCPWFASGKRGSTRGLSRM